MAGKKVVDGVDLSSATDIAQYLGREILRSSEAPNLLQYQPHQKQANFHKSTKRTRLYIGGNRSGKSTGGVVEDLYWLRKSHPWKNIPIPDSEPCRGRVIAVDFVNGIDKIILPQFAQWTPKSMLIKGSWTQSYDKAHKTLNFANGSFVEFMSYDQDVDKFAGTSRHFIHFDEEPPQPIYMENYARIIDTGGYMWFTMTPVEGMTWVYDSIYEPGILGSDLIDVIEVDMLDNPYLSKQAVSEFIAGLSEEEREARVHGRFVQLGGLIYKEFDPRPGGQHVIRGRWTPDKNWEIHESLDHGLSNPTAVLWHAVNSDGDVVVFDEHYQSGLVVSEHARIIKQKRFAMKREPMTRTADPSIKAKDPITGTSILQEYAKHGIYWNPGVNAVPDGIIRVKAYLKPHPKTKRPKLMITENCVNTIKELARYRWKTYDSKAKNFENNKFEEPHKYNDHSCDSLRYFLMSQPDILFRKDKSGPAPAHIVEASRSTNGIMKAGDENRDLSEYQDASLREYHGSVKEALEFDEHLGGIW